MITPNNLVLKKYWIANERWLVIFLSYLVAVLEKEVLPAKECFRPPELQRFLSKLAAGVDQGTNLFLVLRYFLFFIKYWYNDHHCLTYLSTGYRSRDATASITNAHAVGPQSLPFHILPTPHIPSDPDESSHILDQHRVIDEVIHMFKRSTKTQMN